MKHKRILLMLGALLVFMLAFATRPLVQAQNQPQTAGNGLQVAPVRTDLVIEAGKTQTVSVFVQNVTSGAIVVRPVINDFIASDDESGDPRLLLDNEAAPSKSFKKLLDKLADVSLAANERKEIKVNITVPPGSDAGGYYGAIRFVPVINGQSSTVSLTASVGSIFLVKVPGALTEKLQLESLGVAKIDKDGRVGSTSSFFNSGPLMVISRFRNTGNIHTEAFGKFTVKDMRGKIIQETEINNTSPRGNVLPDSIRKFQDELKQKKLFGRYTLEGNFGYGTTGELLHAKTTFYVIPFKLIIGVILLLAFLISLPKLIHIYNNHVIARARRRR